MFIPKWSFIYLFGIYVYHAATYSQDVGNNLSDTYTYIQYIPPAPHDLFQFDCMMVMHNLLNFTNVFLIGVLVSGIVVSYGSQLAELVM